MGVLGLERAAQESVASLSLAWHLVLWFSWHGDVQWMILCCQTAAHTIQHVSAASCTGLKLTFSMKDDPLGLGSVPLVWRTMISCMISRPLARTTVETQATSTKDCLMAGPIPTSREPARAAGRSAITEPGISSEASQVHSEEDGWGC